MSTKPADKWMNRARELLAERRDFPHNDEAAELVAAWLGDAFIAGQVHGTEFVPRLVARAILTGVVSE